MTQLLWGTNQTILVTHKARGLPLVGDHTISPYLSSRQRAQDVRSDEGYHRAPSSLTASPSSLASPADPNASPAGESYCI